MVFQIRSVAFEDGDRIPSNYTCEGDDRSPQLDWVELPAGTKSLALIIEDPDAPDPKAPQRTWAHWVLYNIPPETRGLPEGIESQRLPAGTLEGTNDWRRTGYGGPCPPTGRHRYFHKLFALDTVLPDLGRPTRDALEEAMEGHVLQQAELVGTYQKGDGELERG